MKGRVKDSVGLAPSWKKECGLSCGKGHVESARVGSHHISTTLFCGDHGKHASSSASLHGGLSLQAWVQLIKGTCWCRMHLYADAALVSTAFHIFPGVACTIVCFSKMFFTCKKAEILTTQIRSLCAIHVSSSHVYSIKSARAQVIIIVKEKEWFILASLGDGRCAWV